jgi:NAD(P)-dependent dehydrogenase (short-subunit alcohol dehydrogenase family)
VAIDKEKTEVKSHKSGPRAPGPRTVVVTGASAGIGRAVARGFGGRGDRVGLVARGKGGLEAARKEIEELGGQALVVPTDVAEFVQVGQAAQLVEDAFGPIDVWVNVAFTSVFAPFWQIEPDEFARVTQVSYLGYVHGTRAALDRMRPRDHGTIVQVGSALSERSIPLQSAYCGAKHAINGFTSSVRCELMHDKSRVKITVVQMPAVNTPQFSWVLSRLPHKPQPVPPIYQPEVAAQAVLYAADHPARRQYWAGGSTAATLLANRVAPGLLDRYLARTGFESQQTDEPVEPDRPANLWEPVDSRKHGDFGAHGDFDQRSHKRSWQLVASEKARVLSISMAASVGLAALVRAGRRQR